MTVGPSYIAIKRRFTASAAAFAQADNPRIALAPIIDLLSVSSQAINNLSISFCSVTSTPISASDKVFSILARAF